ncbi:helicase associated domain-containing protein [Streptomyces sp. NBC_00989]|uniref:helicase associated domain-containing protein n=1 Tax=Streptomyces sp. NBC_00989 TaxID=2903705 RepID=UPI00386B9C20|nr:helicase associated domain-containing protein [Streptomyces sp. NBC_00989]
MTCKGQGQAAVPGRRSQDERWATHLTAARQYHDGEGHLHVPRKHTETIKVGGACDSGQETVVRLGTWTDNTARPG